MASEASPFASLPLLLLLIIFAAKNGANRWLQCSNLVASRLLGKVTYPLQKVHDFYILNWSGSFILVCYTVLDCLTLKFLYQVCNLTIGFGPKFKIFSRKLGWVFCTFAVFALAGLVFEFPLSLPLPLFCSSVVLSHFSVMVMLCDWSLRTWWTFYYFDWFKFPCRTVWHSRAALSGWIFPILFDLLLWVSMNLRFICWVL